MTNASGGSETLFEVPAMPPELGTRDRLRALEGDSRAKFLPATHLEKNWALSLLDYIDILEPDSGLRRPNKSSPARTAGQLQEVFQYHVKLQWKKFDADPEAFDNDRRKVRPQGVREGQRALRSISFAFGDFLGNAMQQRQALRQLDNDVKDCPNPNVTIEEELGVNHPGLPAFVRFFDLEAFRRSGISPVHGYDLLRTAEVRENTVEVDRNKYVEDQYTATARGPAIETRIEHVARSLTIGAARRIVTRGNFSLIQAAVIDQQNRASFWTGRLREARLHGAARPIADRVLMSLDIQIR